MKTTDEREIQKTTKEKQTKTERSKGKRSKSDRVRAKWFLNEDPTLKEKALLQRFLHKLKQKNFSNQIEYDKLYPSGSAPFVSMVLLKCTNSLLVIHFLNFVRLFHL